MQLLEGRIFAGCHERRGPLRITGQRKLVELLAAIRSGGTNMESGYRLLTVGQAAAYVGVSPASLRKWANDGRVHAYRTPGGQRRFSVDDLDDFVRSMRSAVD
jgi:excisionase family DNA binding protein